ncbi:MAG: hypothetical protein ACXAB7_14885 [Candidatus Kariarchaeaceae archaeon]|jgi:hypothetical protein
MSITVGIAIVGYQLETNYLCMECIREYVLDRLSHMLSEEDMITLMPTDEKMTSDLVDIYNSKACAREQLNKIYAAAKEVGICDNLHSMYNDFQTVDYFK